MTAGSDAMPGGSRRTTQGTKQASLSANPFWRMASISRCARSLAIIALTDANGIGWRLSDAPAQAPPAALDRLFVEALAECEEEERRKQLPIGPPVHEGLRQDDAPPASDATWVLSRAAGPPAPTTVDWLHAGRLTLKALGMMIVLLLGTFATLILHLI